MSDTGTTEELFSEADEFFERLSPTHPSFRGFERPIFRGQGDASWGLIPKAMRRNAFEHPLYSDTSMHSVFEFIELSRFCQFCDETGVRVPGDSINFRKASLSLNSAHLDKRDPSKWFGQELLEAMAFAQHHGIRTRLLDWSRNPYAALYFAVSSSLRMCRRWKPKSRLAVWVLNLDSIGIYDGTVSLVEPPGSTSVNLAAQSGLFTFHKSVPDASGSYGGLEAIFTLQSPQLLTKLVVPTTQSIQLYKYCSKVGFTAARLFPGPDGAARAVADDQFLDEAERWLLDKKPDLEANQRTSVKEQIANMEIVASPVR